MLSAQELNWQILSLFLDVSNTEFWIVDRKLQRLNKCLLGYFWLASNDVCSRRGALCLLFLGFNATNLLNINEI